MIFSTLRNSTLFDKTDKLDKNQNLKLIYTESDFTNNNLIFSSKLYQSNTGFYIYTERVPFDENFKYQLTVYHLPTQTNEIIIFLKFINK